jgi:hypothetical protein
MAASLARLARSAPEKPGVSRATTIGSTLGSSFLSRQCTARIAARSVSVERLLRSGAVVIICEHVASFVMNADGAPDGYGPIERLDRNPWAVVTMPR